MDKVRTESIKGTAHVRCVGDKCRECRFRWFGDGQRRDSDYVGKSLVLPKRRSRGRLKRKFVDVDEEDMSTVSKVDAEDRVKWRRGICQKP